MSTTAPIDRDLLAPVLHRPTPVSATPDGSAPVPTARPAERHLRPVRSAIRARRGLSPLLAALTSVGIVLGILGAQLGLSIAVSEGAYEARALELEQRDLLRVERVLSQNVDKLSSPQNLAVNAAQLGMVQNSTPATLRLSDGAVLGALQASTSAAQDNLVPNATLEALPVLDAEGLLVSRSERQAAEAAEAAALAPVPWQGKLPAPVTR